MFLRILLPNQFLGVMSCDIPIIKSHTSPRYIKKMSYVSLCTFFFQIDGGSPICGDPDGFHPSLRMPFQVTTFGRVLEEHPEMTGSLNRKIAMSNTKKSRSGQVHSVKSWFMKFTCFFLKNTTTSESQVPAFSKYHDTYMFSEHRVD